MSDIKIEFSGSSMMMRLYFVGKDFIDRIEEENRGNLNNFDWLDFLEQNTLSSRLICRGLDADKPMKIKIYDDSGLIFEGRPNCNVDEEELLDPDLYDLYGDQIFGLNKDAKDIDEELLYAYGIPVGYTSESEYGYCVIERFESFGSTGICYLPQDQGFRVADVRLVAINMDPGHTEDESLGHCLYEIGDVELELDSVKYAEGNYPIELNIYSGGVSEWLFLKNRRGFWGDAEKLTAKINKTNRDYKENDEEGDGSNRSKSTK